MIHKGWSCLDCPAHWPGPAAEKRKVDGRWQMVPTETGKAVTNHTLTFHHSCAPTVIAEEMAKLDERVGLLEKEQGRG